MSDERRNATVRIRLPAEARDIIDAAAAVEGKTRRAFVVDSARQRAVDVLLDQCLIELKKADWDAFNRALDAPPVAGRRLRELMGRRWSLAN